jgi:hypothetical protein
MSGRGRGRGRGGGRMGAGAQPVSVGPKILFDVRESNQAALDSYKSSVQHHLTHVDDTISIFSGCVATKFRGKSLNLDSGKQLLGWRLAEGHHNEGFLTVRDGIATKEVHAYQKTIALIDPYCWMRYKERPAQPFFWQFQTNEVMTPENQAYVDCMASSLASKLRTHLQSPHFPEFYGAVRGMVDVFHYNLEDDFEEYRFTEWFWKAVDAGEFGLRIVEKTSGRQLSMEEINNVFRPDAEFLTDASDAGSESSDESDDEGDDSGSLGAESLPVDEPATPCVVDLQEVTDDFTAMDAPPIKLRRKGQGAGNESVSSNATSEASFSEEYTLHAELKQMPVVVMYCEKMENTLDELLEQPEYAPVGNRQQQEAQWTAWLFQICAALVQLQNTITLIHNDLHSSNVLWRKTSEEYLWYKDTKGRTYRVPTYGYIFSIIDYGRAIFTVNGHTCVSSDYDEGHDAYGMYNFGPIQDDNLPVVRPNRSFDLCRLACSLVRGLYPCNPEQKTKGAVLTKEVSGDGHVAIRETMSPLFNLLWGWLKMKDGGNVLETDTGDEKYPGFDLYVAIAADVKDAVPDAQLLKAIFQQFLLRTATSRPNWIVIPM